MKPKKGGGGSEEEKEIFISLYRYNEEKNWKTESRKKLVFAGELEGI